MRTKKLLPFVLEFLSLVLYITILLFCFLYSNFIKISINSNFLISMAIVLFILLGIFNFSRIVNWGVRAILDLLINRTEKESVEFLSQSPYKASELTTIIDSNHRRKTVVYYVIQCKKNGNINSYISPCYLHIDKGEKIIIYKAPISNVILDYSKIEK